MGDKQKAVAAATRDTVKVDVQKNEASDSAIARTLTRPEMNAACVIQAFNKSHEVNSLASELSAQAALVNGGNLGRVEGILVAQAHTLDALFTSLSRRAHLNLDGGHLVAGETYLRLALKAQSQCRATSQTLAEIKMPRSVAFVNQANIAQGPQQVNNVTPDAGVSRTRKTENEQTQLLEHTNGERLDARAASTASSRDSTLAAVGIFDGAKIAGR